MKEFLTSPEGYVLVGLAVAVITQLAKRLKIKPEIALTVIAIVIGVGSVFAHEYIAPETLAMAATNITTAVGTANLLYMAFKGDKGLKTFDQINKK